MTDIQHASADPPQSDRWLCPQCRKAPMGLTRIEPGGPGIDSRTFECARCQHIETLLVAFI
jgi:hypothetical protein